MLKKLVSIVIVLGLAGSASALVVSDTQTWDERTQLGDLGGLEITATGHAIFNARTDHDECDVIIHAGGILETNDTYKHPDDNGPSNSYIDGTWNANNIESFGPERDAHMYMNVNGVINISGDTGDERYNPQHWLDEGNLLLDPSLDPGVYEIVVEMGSAKVYVIPEPATIMLLGLGSLALIRRRK